MGAWLIGGYAALALLAALLQTSRVAEGWAASGPQPESVTWLAWWVLSGVVACVTAVAGFACALVLGRLADATAPELPSPAAKDHYE